MKSDRFSGSLVQGTAQELENVQVTPCISRKLVCRFTRDPECDGNWQPVELLII